MQQQYIQLCTIHYTKLPIYAHILLDTVADIRAMDITYADQYVLT